MINNRKLPVGIQSFEKLRIDGGLYVDKTEMIYRLVSTNTPYFLSRPRRFGKSLLLSTMKAYWEGRRDLFQGLKIDTLQKNWEAYPVFYIDFNKDSYQGENDLERILIDHLCGWEALYGCEYKDSPLGLRFAHLMIKAKEQTGKNCVVLVDEYDKPLLGAMNNSELLEKNKETFKSFFSVLKSYDEYLRFVFITGVTRFSKVSIFSDLNQLRDISMTADYASLCGITEEEMKAVFMPEIEELAKSEDLSVDECLVKLRNYYDGYHFHQKGEGVYNPLSLLCALADREFDSYWFETGTPAFLLERLKKIRFSVSRFMDRSLLATKRELKDYSDENPDPVPLLYQTGYLTLVDYDPKKSIYTLGFPNDEVRYGFLNSLMPLFVSDYGASTGKDILSLEKYIETGDIDRIQKVITALFAGIPYTSKDAPFEYDFQAVLYITLTLLGQYAQCEVHTSEGRIDCVVETKSFVYLFEFKRDKSADEALRQIEDMHYDRPYAADDRKIFKIGVNFSSETRMPEEWKVIPSEV